MLIPADRITLRSWLAWYHMLAGGAGMITTLLCAPDLLARLSADLRQAMGLIILVMLALFTVVAWAGVLLSIRSPWAERVTTIVQLFQIPVIRIGSFLWMFFGGGYLVGYWGTENGLGGMLGAKANLELSWGGAPESLVLGINLVPLVILWMLRRALPRKEAQSAAVDQTIESLAPVLASASDAASLPDADIA